MMRGFRVALRALRRRPLFTVVSIATLSLGIGATTAVYSFVDGVLLSPLPYPQPERLMTVQVVIPEWERETVPSPRAVDAWGRGCETSCREVAAMSADRMIVGGAGGTPETLDGWRVTPGFFELLGVEPLLGRVFGFGEREPAVVLTFGLWQRRFGGDPSVLGRVVTLNDQPVEIVGVLPASFRFPRFQHLKSVEVPSGRAQFFATLTWPEWQVESFGNWDYPALLRLPPDTTAAQAATEMNAVLEHAFAGGPVHPRVRLQPLSETVTAAARGPLWLLLAAAVAVLLIAVVNLSGMLGARWLERRREVALRRALGAPPRDAILLVLRECLVLTAAGGVGGLVTAHAGLRALLAFLPADLPRIEEVAMDGSVLAAATGVTLVCGVSCALVPAWQARRADPMETIKTDNAAARRQGTGPGTLVALEVAFGTGLLIVAGLLIGSFLRVLNTDRGFEVENLLAATVVLPPADYQDPERVTRFHDEVLRELRNAPGVRGVGLVQRLPLEGNFFIDTLARVDDQRPSGERPQANYRFVNPDYLRTMGIAVSRGRMFTEEDRGRRPIVISEDAARILWPGEDPIGRSVRREDDGPPREVVGVTVDARIVSMELDAGPVAYVPYWDLPIPGGIYVVRTAIDPTAMAASMTEAVRRVDPLAPPHDFRTMNAVLARAVALRRAQFSLTAAFALAGVLLVGLGVYGVVATWAARRRTEFAIRLALGGGARRLVAMVLRQGMRPAAIGVVLGLGVSAAAGRAMAALLYEVSPYDWVVLGTAVLVVLTAVAAGCLVPAVRAVHIPVWGLLRSE
jgi:putative ABC transport system permease protein